MISSCLPPPVSTRQRVGAPQRSGGSALRVPSAPQQASQTPDHPKPKCTTEQQEITPVQTVLFLCNTSFYWCVHLLLYCIYYTIHYLYHTVILDMIVLLMYMIMLILSNFGYFHCILMYIFLCSYYILFPLNSDNYPQGLHFFWLWYIIPSHHF